MFVVFIFFYIELTNCHRLLGVAMPAFAQAYKEIVKRIVLPVPSDGMMCN